MRNLDITFEKLTNHFSFKWSYKENKNGDSLAIGFNSEDEFIEFCNVTEEAKKRYLKLKSTKKL